MRISAPFNSMKDFPKREHEKVLKTHESNVVSRKGSYVNRAFT
jgi:hypothetical protein